MVGRGSLGMDASLEEGFLVMGNFVLVPFGMLTMDATFILLAMGWSLSESSSIMSLCFGMAWTDGDFFFGLSAFEGIRGSFWSRKSWTL